MLRRTLCLLFLLGPCACGDVSFTDNNVTAPPAISAFTADPAALAAGGGTSTLSWTVVNQDSLLLNPGNLDVSSYLSAKVTSTVTTTYTLQARNSLGEVTGTVTVTVGP